MTDPQIETEAYLRLKAAAKKASDGAALEAMRSMRRVYQLCRTHADTGTLAVRDVLDALGMDENGEFTREKDSP